ncbi:MAG: hypothetical protein Tsb0013_16600 [Phycisphaerales bacterium]
MAPSPAQDRFAPVLSRPSYPVTAFVAFAMIGIALVFAQPSLTPPAGPIEETGRFGTRIELNDQTAPGDGFYRHVIAQPGSYVLTGDIDTGSGSGILIESDNVTLDLNGYTVSGTGELGIVVPTAISGNREIRGITIRNGRVVGYEFAVEGIDFAFFNGAVVRFTSTLVADLDVRATVVGINIERGIVDRCNVVSRITGVEIARGIVRDTVVRLRDSTTATAVGINALFANIEGCTVDTTGSGATNSVGIRLEESLARGCHVNATDDGFVLNGQSVATDCLSFAPSNIIQLGAQTFSSNF